MSQSEQEDAIQAILAVDSRYPEDAYTFVREGLEYTVHEQHKVPRNETRHVSGQELAQGIRDYAIKEFGPISLRVLHSWGIRETADFGELVYNMIEARILGKTEEDRKEDFAEVYAFDSAFRDPFLPKASRSVDESSWDEV